tara:strand:- start:1218 stop:1340 length:123 start_codon:yes stop_codon:yes gene_type:complete
MQVSTFFSSLIIDTPAGAHGLLEFGFFVAVGMTAGRFGLI